MKTVRAKEWIYAPDRRRVERLVQTRHGYCNRYRKIGVRKLYFFSPSAAATRDPGRSTCEFPRHPALYR